MKGKKIQAVICGAILGASVWMSGQAWADIQGDAQKAIENYEQAISANPNDAEAYFLMGNAYDDLGDKHKAIECYEKAIGIAPNGSGAYYNMCEIDGEDILVVSLKGMGLWGGISGYMAIHGDETPKVYGAYFNHESETAGLGAEIKDSQTWQEQFIGKKIFADGSDTQDVVLSVVKKVDDPSTQVDCVTGATLTSNGVDAMIKDCLKNAGKNAAELFLVSMCTPDSMATEPKAEEE